MYDEEEKSSNQVIKMGGGCFNFEKDADPDDMIFTIHEVFTRTSRHIWEVKKRQHKGVYFDSCSGQNRDFHEENRDHSLHKDGIAKSKE